jgi:2-keto-4-pentenoate hydratase/2-oxohepta-3-ene-1,7-dioic acid hydratase in catechol pathway
MIALPIKNSHDTYPVNPSKLIALGLNYRSHIAESVSVKVKGFTDEVPTEPLLFPKTPNVLIGPGQSIVIPGFLKEYGFKNLRTDYEAELAVIIGRTCKSIHADAAADHILGYTCMNDVSQRNIQNGDRTGWFRGKSLDTFGPIGPQVVLAEDITDPHHLNIRCRLNGKTVQEANTGQMIFKITEIISFISKNITLVPGDIILTGTPAGVGPLNHGDVVEVEIEQIGILENDVIDQTI